jgi:hypothetical protein
MTRKQAIALARKLPKGWLRLVDEKLKQKGTTYTPATISRVKNGKFQNEAIEAALLEVAKDEAVRRAAMDRQIAELSNA